ncbi:MAG: hypothetical protein NC110_01610, partial [Ruminococcus sp.]|nr:hypothetical protein [Ruminococcus sp.]
LLSWYDVEYNKLRTNKDYSNLEQAEAIDYEAIGIDKAQLEKLPSDLDSLVAAIVPAVMNFLPEGALGSIKLEGSKMTEIVHNLVVGLLADSKETVDGNEVVTEGFATKLVAMLVNLLGGNETIGTILPIIKEVAPGVDVTLAYFKEASPAFAEYFKNCDTWADAYEAHKVKVKYNAETAEKDENGNPIVPAQDKDGYIYNTSAPVYVLDAEGNKVPATTGSTTVKVGETTYYTSAGTGDVIEGAYVVKTDANGVVYEYQYEVKLDKADSFGIKTYEDVLALLGDILTPFAPILRLLLTEDNLVLLDGITITAGDGYDRFIVPLFEVFGVENIVPKDKIPENDGEFVDQVINYIDAIITMIVSSPIKTIVDALPQLVFYIYSEGLAQGLEQFIAPIITLVDMVNDITAKKVQAAGKEFVALDIYGLITNLINEKVMQPLGMNNVNNLYELINAFVTADGLESLIEKAIVKAETEKNITIDLGFEIKGLFEMIIAKCCTIGDVKTVRYFGAEEHSNGTRTVKGVTANRADTIIQIICETILGGDLVKNLLNTFGVNTEGTIDTIISAITGENRYVLIKVLLKYFNEYDVETMLLEYLSFDKIDYIYTNYIDGTNFSQRRLRRAIKKFDGSILNAVPGLIPLLEENATFAALLNKIGGYNGQSLKDLVHEILEAYAFNDQMMSTITGLLIGLLGGDDLSGTLSTVLPLVDSIVGIDLTPAGFADKTSSSALEAYLNAAIDVAAAKQDPVLDADGNPTVDEDGNPVTTPHVVTWSDVADYYEYYEYIYNKTTAVVVENEDGTKETTYSQETVSMYSKDANLGGTTVVDPVDGKTYTWFAYEQATDAEGKLLWADEANGIPVAKTVEDEAGNVTKVRRTAINDRDVEDAYKWGISDAKGFEAKKDAFLDIIAGVVTPLEPILNFILRGDDIGILADEKGNNAVLSLKGNAGYENAIYPLLQGLGVDQFGDLVSPDKYNSNSARGTAVTLTAITDAIFVAVDALCDKPFEFLLTLLPSLSYFIASNGVQLVLNNLLSPILSLLDLASPVVGSLIEDLIGKYLSPIIGKYMPPQSGKEVTKENEDGTVETYTTYTIDEITGIAGENGSNLVRIVNELLGGLLAKNSQTGEESGIIKILSEDVFEQYARHTITVSKQNAQSKWYYWYENADGELVKVAADDFKYNEIDADIVESRYVVDSFSVDISDSLVFLLDTVLSEDIVKVIADIAKVDLSNSDNVLSAVLNNLIDGEFNGMIVSNIITALFEGYQVSYAKLNGALITPDHSAFNGLTAEQQTEITKIPDKLDTVISEAIPVLLPILKDLLGSNEADLVKTILSAIDSYTGSLKKDEKASLNGFVYALLGDLAFNNDVVNSLVALVVNLLGSQDIIGTILPIVAAVGIDLTPQGYLAKIVKSYGDKDVRVKAFQSIIGDAKTWKDVAAKFVQYEYTYVTGKDAEGNDIKATYYGAKGETTATIDGTEYTLAPVFAETENEDGSVTVAESQTTKLVMDIDFGVTDKDTFVSALAALLNPLYEVLQVVLQGKTLTLFRSVNDKGEYEYKPVDNTEAEYDEKGNLIIEADAQDGSELGSGYVEIRGVNGYDQALMPLLDALGIPQGKHASEIKSVDEFNAINNIDDMLKYVVDVIFMIVDDLTTTPITFLARNLASLVYFIGNDGVYNLVDAILQLVNAIAALTDPLYKKDGFRVHLNMLKLEDTGTEKGLLSTINNLLANAKIDITLSKEMLFDLAGKMGDYETIDTHRTTADSALVNSDGQYVDKDGNLLAPEDISGGKITTIVGQKQYFLTGLLDFALSDEVVGKLINADSINGVLKDIIESVTGKDAVKNLVDIIIKLFNKYLVNYKAIVDPKTALVKTVVDYSKRTVTKDDTNNAISTLDSLVGQITTMLGLGTLDELLADNLYTDNIVNMLVGLVVGLLGGLDSKLLETIETVLGYVKDIIGIDIQISPEYYASLSDELAGFIGDAKTWKEVADKYTKYAYSYVTGKDKDGKDTTATYYGAAGETKAEIDGKEYDLTKVMSYAYTYTTKDADGKDVVTTVYYDNTTDHNTITVDNKEIALTRDASKDVQVTKVISEYAWGVDAKTGLDAKSEKLVEIITSLLKPFDPILELLLAGGTDDPANAYGDSLGAFKEINIMGGSGYNYAIVPLLEVFGIEPLTQEGYEATLEKDGALGYILNALLHKVNSILDEPVTYIFGLIANLAYTVSKNGLTTIISNLIAPVSELIKAIEGVLPLSVTIDLMGLVTGESVLKLYMGKEVAKNHADVGVVVDLKANSLEKLVNALIKKYISTLDIKFDISEIASVSAATDADGKIIFKDSVVDPKWDKCEGIPGKNITGDPADTIIGITEMILTPENIDALLQMLNVDLSKLPKELGDIINKAIDKPSLLVDAIIKLLNGGIAVDEIKMIYKYLGEELDYNYKSEGATKATVTTAINKLDRVLGNAVPQVIEILAGMEKPIAIVKDIYDGLTAEGKKATLENIVDYALGNFVFNDDMLNTIVGLLVGLLGGLDAGTLDTIANIVNTIVKIDLTPAGIAAVSEKNGGKLAAFINSFAVDGKTPTWAELAKANTKYAYTYVTGQDDEGKDTTATYYGAKGETTATINGTAYALTPVFAKTKNEDGTVTVAKDQTTKVVLDYVWNVDDKDSFLNVVYELTAVFGSLFDFLLRGQDIVLFVEELSFHGANSYDNAIVPLGKALGIELRSGDKLSTSNDMLKEVINGIFGLVDKLEAAPITTILSIVGSASFFIANNGIELTLNSLISPITSILKIVESIVSMDDIDNIMRNYINIGLTDITGIAGKSGEKLVSLINDKIAGLKLVGDDGVTPITNILDDDLFIELSKYAIDVHDVPKPAENEETKNWTVDTTDVLMYLLKTVFSDQMLTLIRKAAKLDSNATVAGIVKGLAGKQDELVEIIVMLLTEYSIKYSKIKQQPITKIDVTPKGDKLNDANIESALKVIDGLVPTILGLVLGDGSSLEGVINNLLKDADLGNLVMNMLVPVLSGLDLDAILGYVNKLTNLNIESIAPQAFVKDAKFGSELKNFIGDAKTWKEVSDKYSQFVYTYTVTKEGKEPTEVTYYSDKANETTVTIGTGADAKTYTLTPVYDKKVDANGKLVVDEAGNPVYGDVRTKAMHSTFNWKLNDLNAIVNLVCDLLAPLDIIFKIILAGEQIIVLKDNKADGSRGDDVRIYGGSGYNYAIIPLFEAFGVEPLTQAEYDALVKTQGSSIKYILDTLVKFVNDLLKAPVQTLLEKLANLFYFIGSDGINTVVENLVAPINILIEEIDDVVPIAISIDLDKLGKAGESVVNTYIAKEHPGVKAGLTIDVKASKLSELINSLIGSIKIGDKEIKLSLDLDWNKIAAMMAKAVEANEGDRINQNKTGAELVKIPTKQDYRIGEVDSYVNIIGDVADTFTTLLQVILTPDNTEGIIDLIKSLIPDTLDPKIKSVLDDILNDPDAIEKLIGIVVLVLTGSYKVNDDGQFVYKVLKMLDFDDYASMDKLDSAISKFDKMVGRAVPKIISMLADTSKPEAEWGILEQIASGIEANPTLDGIVNWFLSDKLLTEETFEKLVQTVVKALAGFLTADLTKTLNDLLGIDLAPQAIAKATRRPGETTGKLVAYVGSAETWAEVLAAHSTYHTELDENAKEVTVYDFDNFNWGVTNKEIFIDKILRGLMPLESVLSFLLMGQPLELADGSIKLNGGKAYANALNPLMKALGLEDLGGTIKGAATANEAVSNVIDYLFVIVDAICKAPLTSIFKVVGNLSYFIANDNIENLIKNLTAPILGIVDLASDLISRDQIDKLIKSLTKDLLSLTDILEIGNNGGKKLIDLINELLKGVVVKQRLENGEEEVVFTINALPDDFFTQLAQYAIGSYKPDGAKVGDVATQWKVQSADVLMFILSTVLNEDFLKTLFQLVGVNTSNSIGATLLTLADKEYDLADIILILLENYTFEYKRIKQTDLGTDTAPYFGGLNKDNTTAAIKTLDPLLVSVLGILGVGNLKDLIDGLISGADLPNMIMNLLVPVLSGLDIDAILGYVNELTNLGISSIAPTAFNAKFGSQLKNFIGDAKTWKEVEAKYAQYVYTYNTAAEGEKENIVTYYSKNTGEKTITIGEGENAKTYNLVPTMVQAVKDGEPVVDENNQPVYTNEQKKAMHSEYDWKIATKGDLANLVCDLLAPFDVVFQILLSGKQIIALEDKSADRADIRINGGYGYNYAIIPLLEAFGVAPLTQAQYDARVRADGSSLKYILDVLFNEIDEILKSPVEQILSRVANIFYFIGSDGINTIAANLLAPVNKLLESVDKLYPIAINIDLSAKEIVKTYIGVEHKNVNAGVNINVSGKALAEFINGFIGNININGTVINLHLDLDWNALAAKMAKTNADGSIAYIGTAQNYGYGTCEAGAALKNISGDAADALVTILDAVLTKNNCKNIKDLVDSLLAGTTLPEEVKNIINDILSDPNAIKNLVAAVILILTGGYSVTNLNFIFKYLGNIDYNVQDVDKAVTSLDKVLLAAVPVIIDLLADTSKPEAEQSFIDKLAAGLEKEGKQATIENIVDYLLGSMVFTNDMMATITSAIVNALGGFLTADLANTLNSLIGINLAPVAFANKTGNAQFKAYVNVTPADATVGVTWADVLKAHQKTVGDKVVIAPIFTNASSKDGFISDVLDMLKPLEDILAFLLTGKDLSLTVDGTNLMTLAAGNAYNKALLPLILKGLGLKELGAVEKTANTANAAIANVVEYVFNLVDALEAAPFSTILTVVSNLSFFIANNDVSVAINNLVAPILGIVDALDGVISRDQIDGLLKNFIKIGSTSLGLTDIIHIADNEGENLIKIINELLGNIEVKDDKGETVYVLNALPVDFFVNLAKAAIKIDQPTGNLKVGTDVTEWHTEKGDAIMYVLSTVLNKDFLEILCTLLNLDPTSDIGQIIISLAGREQDLIGVILKLLNKYLVEYKAFNVPELNKITVEYSSDKTHQQLNDALAGIDSLIPTVLALVGQDAQNLGDIVYPLFVKDDIANLLVSTIAKLLAGLPSDTIDQVMGYVNDLTNLKNLDIAPKAFANVKFGSKLGAYIGNAKTWADVWNAHSVETVDEEGNATRTATSYDWGIKTTADLVNLVCDMLLPLDDILALLLMGGTERAAFEADGTHNGSKITAFDEINVIGGDGYNYSIIPLLELLGVKNVKTQAEYEAFVKANHGSTLKYILDAVFGRVDEILNAPIASVLDILANLAYAIGNDNVETIVANLLAPVNNLIEAVDRLFPISISINLGNIGTSESIIETYLGKQHPGVPAGIAIALKGSDINSLLANVLGGIMINGNPLGLNLDLNWIQIAQTAAAEGNNKKIKMNSSKLDTKYDIYNGSAYKNVVGDRADSFVALIKAILTKDNLDAILKALGQENGFGDPIDSIIDAIIENPEKIIDVLLALLGNGKVSYVPIQNRLIKTQRFDYSTYFLLTETNADIIAENLDSIITRILSQAGMGSLKQFVGTNYITGDTLNMLLDKIVPLLGGDTVNNILVALADFAKQNNVSTDLDLTVASFYKKFINNKDYKNPTNVNIRAAANVLKAAVDKNGTWADVGSFEGVNWGFAPGDIHGFARAFADVLKPLNSILELLLMG